MFRKLLVPVDLSERNRIVLAALPGIAAAGASVELLHVVERLVEGPDPEFDLFYRALQRKAQNVLEPWCKELCAQGFAARVEIRMGRRGAEILERARAGCDLIAMASHALTGPDARLGTLSHQVAMIAPCPVLLLR